LSPSSEFLEDAQGMLDTRVPILFQQYIKESHGRDLRVIVVDGVAVSAELRTATDGRVTSNLSQGGTAVICPGRYPVAEKLAVRAADVLGLTVAGVDLLFREDGSFTLCEVNNNVAWAPDHPGVPIAIAQCVADRVLAAEESMSSIPSAKTLS
jgi:glutathione synthase/RimK-type ligase-like ATP-grasp enzyme